MRVLRSLVVLTAASGIILLATSGSFLVVNEFRRSDVIVVLAGETRVRPALGLKLLRAGYAPRMILDVPARDEIYGSAALDLAQTYVRSLPEAKSISICAIYSQSTRGEAGDVGRCLDDNYGHSILLVTSDYHTRRALSIFRHELRRYSLTVAGATDDSEFGVAWWRRRQWAKMNFDEWLKLVWWESLDRWRSH